MNEQKRQRSGTVVSITGIVLNILLFGGKFAVGTLFGSVAIRADAINNLSDAGSQLISLISFRIRRNPPTANTRSDTQESNISRP